MRWFHAISGPRFHFAPRAGPRFALALLLGSIGLGLGVTLPAHWKLKLPFVTVYTVLIMISACFGGLWPGLVCTVLCVGGVAYWLAPGGSFSVQHGSDIAGLALFAVIGAVISVLNEKLHHARRLEHDARERAEKATETEHASRMAREQILAVVAHDLRSPLSAIQLNTKVMEHVVGGADVDREALRKRIANVQGNVTRMTRIIGDLLDMAAIDAGTLSIEASPESVGSLIDETMEVHEPDAAGKGLQIESEAPHDLPPVLCDRGRVLQVLSNLTSNAIKFTPRGGQITLSASACGDSVEIRVRDTGPGIPPQRLSRIFDRDWHERRATGGGTGLGLFIARGIVETHDGTLWVESTEGEGSSFFFTLPVARP